MNKTDYLTNKVFFQENKDGAIIYHIAERPINNVGHIFNVINDGNFLVIEGKMDDPATLLEKDPAHPETWQKREFATLGKNPDHLLKKEAERRFNLSYQDILASKRTIGTMSTVIFVFDSDRAKSDIDRIKIAVVQRTKTGPDGTPNIGAFSRFGGGATGGTQGQGNNGAQNLSCQTYRELLEEFHPYIRSEGGNLTPVDIIPQGFELNGLRGEFMKAVMEERLKLSSRIEKEIIAGAYKVSVARETLMASSLSIPGITKPVIQIIEGKEVLHPAFATFDGQLSNGNMDFNTDAILVVRVKDIEPDDFILLDGETDQQTGRLLNRIIFFGNPEELKRSANGEILQLHEHSDMTKKAAYSPAFRQILEETDKLTNAALNHS